MDYYRAFPPYMGYQGYGQWAQPGMIPEDRMLEDMEYLQQMYPTYARKYQSTINSFVDRMDYDGSFIYDQYPDKIQLEYFVSSILAAVKKENDGNSSNDNIEADNTQVLGSDERLRELITVLFYDELLKRRHKQQKYYFLK